jgi:LacI family transcriptional regulator
MEIASLPGRVALLLDPLTLGRLTPGLLPLVSPDRDFGAIDIGEDPGRILAQLHGWAPVGLIMEFREELTELVASMGRPTVMVMADLVMDGVGGVNVDDYAAGKLAADYLWGKGLRAFGFYGRESLHAPERRTGYAEALAGRGRRARVLEIEPQGEAADPLARRRRLDPWLEGLPRPVGIFAAHDPLGRDVLEACARLGLRVPEDVAVLSASNDQFTCELVHPPLSSVEIPWRRLGLEAGRLLERLIAGEPAPEPLLIGPSGIRTRRSTDFYRVSDPRVQRAVGFMRARLAEPIDIPAVARAAGVDRRALERLFRRQLQRTPKEVLTGMRVERARELLEQSGLRVGEIAGQCGFARSEQLAAAFRRRFGKTPRDWRR